MKKNFILLFVFLITHSLFSQRIKGSDTVLPVAQKHAEEYMKIHSNSRVTVTGGGSGVGLSALYEGTTDLAMSSRKIKFEEKIKLYIIIGTILIVKKNKCKKIWGKKIAKNIAIFVFF